MKEVLLTRVYRFNAGHRLFRPDRDEAWNLRVYGKCSHPDGHGHNYTLEVTVAGEPDRDTGFVVRRAELDAQVGERVIEPLDHHDLNGRLELRCGPTPTTEVLAIGIWERLAPAIPPPARLAAVRVRETSKNSFEVRGSR